MTNAFTPDQMMWRFDGYQLVLDEDGLHLRMNGRSGFEQVELLQLIERYEAIQDVVRNHGFSAPPPPTPEQIKAMGHDYAERRVIEKTIRDLRAQLANTSDTTPF